MKKYYEELPSLKLNYEQSQFGSPQAPRLFEHCEYRISGDFLIVYQDILKSVIPLIKVDSLEYPFPSQEKEG